MTEAMHTPLRRPAVPASLSVRTANGAPLRWTPGPDELRLPDCEDEPVPQNTLHDVAVGECAGSLRLHLRGRRDVFVGSDQFVYWDRTYDPKKNPDNPPLSPDVCVAIGVANRHHSSYVVWEEGKPPDFVLEVASPWSRKQDADEKPGQYAKMGVREFFLYDPEGEPESAVSGFELCGGRGGEYKPLPREQLPEGAVGVRSEVLDLYLCTKPPGPEPLDGSLSWYDPAAGEFLPQRYELAEGKRRAEARAREARADAKQAEAEASASKAEAEQAKAKIAALKAQIEKMQRG